MYRQMRRHFQRIMGQLRYIEVGAGSLGYGMQKKLIEEKGRLELPGRPLVYGTTPEFLRCFSVSDLGELPELPNHDAEQSIEAVMEAAGQPLNGESVLTDEPTSV